MSGRIVNIRGYDIMVEVKSGSQLRFICKQLERKSDLVLEMYAKGSKDDTESNVDGI